MTPVHTPTKLEISGRQCDPLKSYPKAPWRFKLKSEVRFHLNHFIYANVFYTQKRPITDIVEEATYYHVGTCLPPMNAT